MKLWREPFKFHLTVVGAITEASGAFCVSFNLLIKAASFLKEKQLMGALLANSCFRGLIFPPLSEALRAPM